MIPSKPSIPSVNSREIGSRRRGAEPAPALSEGLKLRWKLDELSGTTAADSAAGLYPGTIGGVFTLGQPGRAAFTGTSFQNVAPSASYVENVALPPGLLSSGASLHASIAFWVNHGNLASNPYFLTIGKGSGGGTENFLRVAAASNGGITSDGLANGAYFAWGAPPGTSSNGNDYHYVLTFSAANALRLYKNGVLQTFTQIAGAAGLAEAVFANTVNSFCLFAAKDASGARAGYLQGWMDEASLWDKELTAAEVTALYTTGLP